MHCVPAGPSQQLVNASPESRLLKSNSSARLLFLQILDAEPQAAPSPLFLNSTPQQSLPVSSRMVQIIQEYRSIVNVMASLLLRIDEEGVTSEIADQLATSGRQSVSIQLQLVAYFMPMMPDNTSAMHIAAEFQAVCKLTRQYILPPRQAEP